MGPDRGRKLAAGAPVNHIARGPYMGDVGSELLVDANEAALVKLDTNPLDTDVVCVGDPAGRNEQAVSAQSLLGATLLGHDDGLLALLEDATHRHAGDQVDALGAERLGERERHFGL